MQYECWLNCLALHACLHQCAGAWSQHLPVCVRVPVYRAGPVCNLLFFCKCHHLCILLRCGLQRKKLPQIMFAVICAMTAELRFPPTPAEERRLVMEKDAQQRVGLMRCVRPVVLHARRPPNCFRVNQSVSVAMQAVCGERL